MNKFVFILEQRELTKSTKSRSSLLTEYVKIIQSYIVYIGDRKEKKIQAMKIQAMIWNEKLCGTLTALVLIDRLKMFQFF